MENWQLQERHHKDLEEAHKVNICAPNGFVRKYNGKEFWKRFIDLGHSSTDFKLCDCKNKK